MNLGFVNPDDPHAVRRAFQTLQDGLGFKAKVIFSELTLTGLDASEFVFTDANKVLSSVDVPLVVTYGGTGAASLTDHSLLVGSGTGAITALGAATNGQLPIGSTGVDPTLATLTGTANQITVTNGAGSITLSLPQDYDAGATPTLGGLTIVNAITEFSKDGTLGDNSDSALPSEKAVKTYVDSALAFLEDNVSGQILMGLDSGNYQWEFPIIMKCGLADASYDGDALTGGAASASHSEILAGGNASF